MKFIMDESMSALGIKSIVVGIAKNVDPQATLSDAFLKKQKEMEEWALKCDIDEIFNHPVIQGYTNMLQSVGRSIKKYMPTVPALIRNIQHRGSIPHINSVIDVFLPILSTEKHVAKTDYMYRDLKGIMAWLDVRDGENYKFDDKTKNAIFIIQGNANTSVEMRVEALKRIQSDLAECMPQLEFDIQVIEG